MSLIGNGGKLGSAGQLSGNQIRRVVLQQSRRANVGHIGSALSVADIIASLYSGVLKISVSDPEDMDRDRFVLSKGHASLALYAALYLRGFIGESELNTYCADGSLLGVHPGHHLRGVDFSTGSLGHGLSIGAGAALAARLQDSKRRVVVLVSDAECNAGSLWEAVMFAAHHRLSNLVVIIDNNGQQAFGYTKDVLDLSPISEKWHSFNWVVHEVDGNDTEQISAVLNGIETGALGRPNVLVAQTVCGKGVSFMENQIKWHYWPMSEGEYLQALREVENSL